jgi:hypothetical protein
MVSWLPQSAVHGQTATPEQMASGPQFSSRQQPLDEASLQIVLMHINGAHSSSLSQHPPPEHGSATTLQLLPLQTPE